MERKTIFVLGETGWHPVTSTPPPDPPKQFPTIPFESQPPKPRVYCAVPSPAKTMLPPPPPLSPLPTSPPSLDFFFTQD